MLENLSIFGCRALGLLCFFVRSFTFQVLLQGLLFLCPFLLSGRRRSLESLAFPPVSFCGPLLVAYRRNFRDSAPLPLRLVGVSCFRPVSVFSVLFAAEEMQASDPGWVSMPPVQSPAPKSFNQLGIPLDTNENVMPSRPTLFGLQRAKTACRLQTPRFVGKVRLLTGFLRSAITS